MKIGGVGEERNKIKPCRRRRGMKLSAIGKCMQRR
jgi:hypothetical protein